MRKTGVSKWDLRRTGHVHPLRQGEREMSNSLEQVPSERTRPRVIRVEWRNVQLKQRRSQTESQTANVCCVLRKCQIKPIVRSRLSLIHWLV